jgi:hypothetical protein
VHIPNYTESENKTLRRILYLREKTYHEDGEYYIRRRLTTITLQIIRLSNDRGGMSGT